MADGLPAPKIRLQYRDILSTDDPQNGEAAWKDQFEPPAIPTALSILIAQDKPLAALGPAARDQWARVRDELNQPFWSEKYDAEAIQEAKDALTGFIAPGSTTPLSHVEKSLDKLSTSLLPAKAPAELEKTFWQRVAEAKHQSYLFQLHAIYKAAALSTEHVLAKAEFGVLSFARSHAARVNQLAVDRIQQEAAPAPAPDAPFAAPAPAERFHDLPARVQSKIRSQIAIAVNDIEKVKPDALSPSQRAAVRTYLRTVNAYLHDAAMPADLAIAAAAIDAAAPARSLDSASPGAWRAIELDARTTATLARELTACRKPPAAPAPASPSR